MGANSMGRDNFGQPQRNNEIIAKLEKAAKEGDLNTVEEMLDLASEKGF